MPARTRTGMPGKKQVHFSGTTTVHSPLTPELSYGSLSPASSDGILLTPPSYTQGLPGPTPYIFPFSPSSSHPVSKSLTRPRLHSFLCSSSSPAINYDLTQPTSTISSPHHGIPRFVLSESATTPASRTVTIVSPHLPWSITVAPSTHHTYVSVDDVLEGIYRALRTNVTHQEYHSLPTEKDRRNVANAYEQRYRRIRSAREYEDEKSRGVRRVDFLMGYSKFRGLSLAPGRDAWVLNTG